MTDQDKPAEEKPPEEPKLPETINVGGRDLPYDEVVQRAARALDQDAFAQRQEEAKAKFKYYQQAEEFFDIAAKDSSIAAKLNAIHAEALGQATAPQPAQANGADDDTGTDAAGAIDNAARLQSQALGERVARMESQHQEREFARSLEDAYQNFPMLKGNQSAQKAVETIVRQLRDNDPSIKLADAVADAHGMFKEAVEAKEHADREALRKRSDFSSPNSGGGSPRITPPEKPTFKALMDGSLMKQAASLAKQAFSPSD